MTNYKEVDQEAETVELYGFNRDKNSDLSNKFIPGFDLWEPIDRLIEINFFLADKIAKHIYNGGKMEQLEGQDAMEYALEKINGMRFGSDEEKLMFSHFYNFLVNNNYLHELHFKNEPSNMYGIADKELEIILTHDSGKERDSIQYHLHKLFPKKELKDKPIAALFPYLKYLTGEPYQRLRALIDIVKSIKPKPIDQKIRVREHMEEKFKEHAAVRKELGDKVRNMLETSKRRKSNPVNV